MHAETAAARRTRGTTTTAERFRAIGVTSSAPGVTLETGRWFPEKSTKMPPRSGSPDAPGKSVPVVGVPRRSPDLPRGLRPGGGAVRHDAGSTLPLSERPSPRRARAPALRDRRARRLRAADGRGRHRQDDALPLSARAPARPRRRRAHPEPDADAARAAPDHL